MSEEFRNDRNYLVDIPRYNVRAQPGTLFFIPDDDNGSLYDDTGLTYIAGNTTDVLLTENNSFLTLEDSYTLIATS